MDATELFREAVETAIAVEKPEDRAKALLFIAKDAPEPARTEALSSALVAGRECTDPYIGAVILGQVAREFAADEVAVS